RRAQQSGASGRGSSTCRGRGARGSEAATRNQLPRPRRPQDAISRALSAAAASRPTMLRECSTTRSRGSTPAMASGGSAPKQRLPQQDGNVLRSEPEGPLGNMAPRQNRLTAPQIGGESFAPLTQAKASRSPQALTAP